VSRFLSFHERVNGRLNRLPWHSGIDAFLFSIDKEEDPWTVRWPLVSLTHLRSDLTSLLPLAVRPGERNRASPSPDPRLPHQSSPAPRQRALRPTRPRSARSHPRPHRLGSRCARRRPRWIRFRFLARAPPSAPSAVRSQVEEEDGQQGVKRGVEARGQRDGRRRIGSRVSAANARDTTVSPRC
jgi:hypothetical protein